MRIMEDKETPDIGVITGNFDIIHLGYARLFKKLYDACQQPVILLHEDPSIERPEKLKPIHTIEERIELIKGFFPYSLVQFMVYNTEAELYTILKALRPDVRVLGDDYMGREDYTGYDLGIPVVYEDRSHGWSTTKYKTMIAQSLNEQPKS